MTGEIPSELGNLADLHYLGLNYNRLSGTIPSELGNLTELEYLYLGGNQFTGCISEAVRDVGRYDNDIDELGLPFCS